MCFWIIILSPFHLGTFHKPIQHLNCPKNACTDMTSSPAVVLSCTVVALQFTSFEVASLPKARGLVKLTASASRKSAKFEQTHFISLVMDGRQRFTSDHICWKWRDWGLHCLQFSNYLGFVENTWSSFSLRGWWLIQRISVSPFSIFNPRASWHWPNAVWMGRMSSV